MAALIERLRRGGDLCHSFCLNRPTTLSSKLIIRPHPDPQARPCQSQSHSLSLSSTHLTSSLLLVKIPFSRRGSVSQSHLETQSNAYATINKLPMAPASRRSLFNGSLDLVDGERDYATLDKSARSPLGPVVPGVTSTPISSTLPRRQQAGHSPPDTRGSNFFLNRDGEPQLVGNLS